MNADDSGLSAVMTERRQLINLAYRLLGSWPAPRMRCRRPTRAGTR
nr:hypothetical protein [Amycolatopsis taiwanensis]